MMSDDLILLWRYSSHGEENFTACDSPWETYFYHWILPLLCETITLIEYFSERDPRSKLRRTYWNLAIKLLSYQHYTLSPRMIFYTFSRPPVNNRDNPKSTLVRSPDAWSYKILECSYVYDITWHDIEPNPVYRIFIQPLNSVALIIFTLNVS